MNAANQFMFLLDVFLVGMILSIDSFSAALAMGNRPFDQKDAFRFAFSSGSAEALVTFIGAMAGNQIIRRFEAVDHWIAFALLSAVAIHMAYEGIRDLADGAIPEEKLDFHSFTRVLIVSFATSLDAFGVGIGLGVSNKPLTPFIISIGLWAFTATILGLNLAKKLSERFGPIMNLFGAGVLEVIAFKMLRI